MSPNSLARVSNADGMAGGTAAGRPLTNQCFRVFHSFEASPFAQVFAYPPLPMCLTLSAERMSGILDEMTQPVTGTSVEPLGTSVAWSLSLRLFAQMLIKLLSQILLGPDSITRKGRQGAKK